MYNFIGMTENLDGDECREEESKVKDRLSARLGRIHIFSRGERYTIAQQHNVVTLPR